jgi:hypothetical protein
MPFAPLMSDQLPGLDLHVILTVFGLFQFNCRILVVTSLCPIVSATYLFSGSVSGSKPSLIFCLSNLLATIGISHLLVYMLLFIISLYFYHAVSRGSECAWQLIVLVEHGAKPTGMD